MKKIIYTKPDGTVSVVYPAAKKDVEKTCGPMTDDEYNRYIKEQIYSRSIPKDATNIREIDDTDLPQSREFRNAWVDVTPESRIDICCTKAKEIKLQKLRQTRNKKLTELDVDFIKALESNDEAQVQEIKAQKNQLRDITNPLKDLDTTNKYNDTNLLATIKTLSNLE